MTEEIQVSSNPVDPASQSVKRKRGRPRKEDGPGSESGSRRRRKTYSCDISVGQVVSGVLDGRFDAGYMLTVRVGDGGPLLRGVVFEPGQSVPISAANDIAPHVSLVRRVELPIPNIDLKFHTSLKGKDPVTASVASKIDPNSLPGAVKTEPRMDPIVYQSSGPQQPINQNCSVTALKCGASNTNSSSTVKGSSLYSESRVPHASGTFHSNIMCGVNEKGQLPTSEIVKPDSTSMPLSAAHSNSQAVDSNNNKIAGKCGEFSGQIATQVVDHTADANKEVVADPENQALKKNTAVFLDPSPHYVKTEVRAQDNVVSSFLPEPKVNPNGEPDSMH